MLTENLDALSAMDKALLIILQVKVLMIGGSCFIFHTLVVMWLT